MGTGLKIILGLLVVMIVGVPILALGMLGGIQGTFAPGSSLNCEFSPVTVDNQTFSSVSEFKQGVEQRGGDFSQIQSRVDFRVQSGVLEYKLQDSECEDMQEVNQ